MRTGKRSRRAFAALLAVVMAAGLFSGALAEHPYTADVDLIMARNAVMGFNIRGEDGRLLEPRRAPELLGRGLPDVIGEEPDYRGVVGYVSLQSDWEVSKFNTFSEMPWLIPAYTEKDGEWTVTGSVQHKTPVLVAEQRIRESMAHRYIGYLRVVRLDTHRMIWIDVSQFVTVPYWTYELQDAVRYGYCVAVYRNASRHEPMDRKKHRGTLPDGLRVLMCHTITSRYFSPDRINNPLLGIVFKSKEKQDAYTRTFLFFNEEDLTLIY